MLSEKDDISLKTAIKQRDELYEALELLASVDQVHDYFDWVEAMDKAEEVLDKLKARGSDDSTSRF